MLERKYASPESGRVVDFLLVLLRQSSEVVIRIFALKFLTQGDNSKTNPGSANNNGKQEKFDRNEGEFENGTDKVKRCLER